MCWSACEDNGTLLFRWRNYVDNGHRGNAEAEEIVERIGFKYVQSFKHPILVNFKARSRYACHPQKENPVEEYAGIAVIRIER
jgi:hypothetical protein